MKKVYYQIALSIIFLSCIAYAVMMVETDRTPLRESKRGQLFLLGSIGTLLLSLWIANDYSKKSASGKRLAGSRFQRKILKNNLILTAFERWTQEFGYIKHPSSTNEITVYIKKQYPIYPIFVATYFIEDSFLLEGWVSTGNKDLPFKAGFNLIGSVRIGTNEVNKLFEKIGEPLI